MKVRIKPLTHKMKNRVSSYGDVWLKLIPIAISESLDPKTIEWYLEAVPKHPERPYACWVTPGKDFEVLETLPD